MHTITKQLVAVKIMNKSYGPLALREVQTWRYLRHPNIVQLYEVITTDTFIYFVSGPSLSIVLLSSSPSFSFLFLFVHVLFFFLLFFFFFSSFFFLFFFFNPSHIRRLWSTRVGAKCSSTL